MHSRVPGTCNKYSIDVGTPSVELFSCVFSFQDCGEAYIRKLVNMSVIGGLINVS